MKNIKLSLAAAVSVALFSGAAMADSWNITQSVSAVTSTSVGQNGTTAASTQALNAINAAGTTTIADGSTQTVTMDNAATTTLNQEGAVATSTQALNYTTAGSLEGTFEQSQVGTGPLTLNQQATGDANTQGINIVETGAVVTSLTQSAASTDVSLNQGTTVATGTTATQVGNALISTGAVASVNQDLGADGSDVTLDQQISGTDALQAGNLIDVSDAGASLTAATQDITTTGVGTFTIDQTSTVYALQAGNAAISGGGDGAVTQTIATNALLQDQTDAANSWQAGNYVGPRIAQ